MRQRLTGPRPARPALPFLVLATLAVTACQPGDDSIDESETGSLQTTSSAVTAGGDLVSRAPGRLFSADAPWNEDVSALSPSEESDSIVSWLASHGGWGTSNTLRIDFGLRVMSAGPQTPFLPFTPSEDFYEPDCQNVPFPVPRGGSIEEETGYECQSDGDCHLLVIHEPTRKLYEMWRADMTHGFQGGCAAVWDLDAPVGPSGRGEQCTSADAGGFPVAAMTFTADEVASGSIDHAIRFILPNARIRRGGYVHPASHVSTATRGDEGAPPYGVRFRLRADYPLDSLPSEGARVIARAMQRYGMILADGGRTPLTAADDRDSTHKWGEVGVGPSSLGAIEVKDMEVVGMGKFIKSTGDCER